MTSDIRLRGVTPDDLAIFFEHQLDPDANRMAAFTAADPTDRSAFMTRWVKLLADRAVVVRTVVAAEQIVGHVLSFEESGHREVSYWIGREHWGTGIATAALAEFLGVETTRPLYARVAKDNPGSIRVLEKCGFINIGESSGYSNARGGKVEEFVFEFG